MRRDPSVRGWQEARVGGLERASGTSGMKEALNFSLVAFDRPAAAVDRLREAGRAILWQSHELQRFLRDVRGTTLGSRP